MDSSDEKFGYLFVNNPLSMWIYDFHSLAFLDVNEAAVAHYGYTRDEFLKMRITDIRPPEDVARLLASLSDVRPDLQNSGEWRHQLKDGQLIDVQIASHILDFAGRKAVLVVAQDITARKETEAALRNSEKRFRALFEHSLDGILLLSPDRTILYESPASLRMFGFTQGRMGQQASMSVHPDDVGFGARQIEDMLRNPGVAIAGQIRVQHADGSWRWIERVVTNLLDEPSVEAIVVNSRDVTERRLAEDALRESENRFRMVVETAPGGIVAVDRTGAIVLINERIVTLFGYSREELIGAPVDILLPERFRGGHVAHREAYFANPIARPMGMGRDLAARRKDGTEFPVEIGLNYTIIDQGLLSLAFITDISQRKAAEAALTQALANEKAARAEAEAANERMAFLLEASFVLADSSEYVTRLQDLARLAVPYIADWCAVDLLAEDGALQRLAVVHTDPAKVQWAFDLQRRYPANPNSPRGVYQVLRTGQPDIYFDIPDSLLESAAQNDEQRLIIRQLGMKSVMVIPLLARERTLGALTLVMAESDRRYTLNDLELATDLARRAGMLIENARLYHETKQLNLELEARVVERTTQLETANKELEAFTYSVSHDLRSPLRAIDGFSRMLLRDYAAQLPTEGQRRLQVVRDNAKRMGQLIDDLLAFSRLSRQPLQKRRVAPADLVYQVFRELSSERENRRVEIQIDDLPLCEADPTLLKQVFVNLLSNALKYTRLREIAQIEIGYIPLEADKNVAYFVKDNGVGFDMRYADKLFGVFQRLHRAEEFDGTGVGLAIVQRVILRHGGRVWAEAQVDQGATFYFTLEGETSHA